MEQNVLLDFPDMAERPEAIDDVTAAREALRSLIGGVRLVPENGKLAAEIQSAGFTGALYETLVAGARFINRRHVQLKAYYKG